MSEVSLNNLVEYCKAYLNLISPARSRINLKTDFIDEEILVPSTILESSQDDEDKQFLLNFSTFYETGLDDYEKLDEQSKKRYEAEKEIINDLDSIKAKAETDQFTKYIQLNFGFIDLVAKPLSEDVELRPEDGDSPEQEKYQFAVFSVPIEIKTVREKYQITLLDNRLTPNFSHLSKILDEKLYEEILEAVNDFEIEGSFNLPIKLEVLDSIYQKIVSSLKKTEGVVFKGEPFDLTNITISLSAKTNYFLTQDLEAIINDIEEGDLLETSLSGWLSSEGLDEDEDLDSSEGQMLFPFASDRYQRGVLGITGNKVSIVQGPPGTGKSQTISNILCHFAAQGKSVLFVSQKDQAIRVVKDTLKKLEIPGLFGYIPNRYSPLHTKDDETDGAANELSRLKTELNKESRNSHPVLEGVDIVDASIKNFEGALSIERKYFQVVEKLREIENYNLKIQDNEQFEKLDLKEYLKELKERAEDLSSTKKDLLKAKQATIPKRILSDLKDINLTRYQNASTKVGDITEEVLKNIKDRGGIGAFRKLHNKRLYSRIVKDFDGVPRKALEIIQSLIGNDSDRDEIENNLKCIQTYFLVQELAKKLETLESELDECWSKSGLEKTELIRLIELVAKGGDTAIKNVQEAHKLQKELELLKTSDVNLANSVIHKARTRHEDQVRYVLQNVIRKRAEEALAHQSVRSIIERVARTFAKSKRAYKTFDKLKEQPEFFDTVKQIFPIWMMSLEDVSRVTPLELGMFDYVIIDESSQCNLGYALPSMVRGRKTIFFGDTLQMRDDTVRFKSNKILQQLAKRYSIPEHLQIKSTGDSVKSVMDIGVLRGYKQKTLRIHYRSPRELIGFSNEYFYKPLNRSLEIANSTFYPYKDTNRSLITHVVKTDRDKELSLKTNTDEANYIVKLIKDIKTQPNYAGESIGVLTFFNDQAQLLRELIDDEAIKVSNIEGIQGDERDIVIYSFVINDISEKRRYVSLTGEGGEINKELNEGRVNVAFSRAKKQVHCVTSLHPEQWPEGIWIKRYLDYVDKFGRLDRPMSDGVNKDLFDSFFEEDLYNHLYPKLNSDYILQNQVSSCGFKIDFVLVNRKTNKKLAIECDGPTHFEDEDAEIVIESDWERQSILQSAGWEFYRIPYSKWINIKEKKDIVKDIIESCDDDITFRPITYKAFTEVLGVNYDEEIIVPKNEEPTKKSLWQEFGDLEEEASATKSPWEQLIEVQGAQLEKKAAKKPKKSVAKSNPANNTDASGSFQEVGRVPLGYGHFIVASTYGNGLKLSLSEYVEADNFTGFTKKNVLLDKNNTHDLINAIARAVDDSQTNVLPWSGGSEISSIIVSPQMGKLDIRQWIKTARYTGFTKKGFRMTKEQANQLEAVLRQVS